MAAWGVDAFSNDDAADFAGELASSRSLALVHSALTAALAPGYLDLADGVAEWLVRRPGRVSAELLAQARQAVQRVRADSELRELWAEAAPRNRAGWEAGVDGLLARLEAPVGPPPTIPRKPRPPRSRVRAGDVLCLPTCGKFAAAVVPLMREAHLVYHGDELVATTAPGPLQITRDQLNRYPPLSSIGPGGFADFLHRSMCPEDFDRERLRKILDERPELVTSARVEHVIDTDDEGQLAELAERLRALGFEVETVWGQSWAPTGLLGHATARHTVDGLSERAMAEWRERLTQLARVHDARYVFWRLA